MSLIRFKHHTFFSFFIGAFFFTLFEIIALASSPLAPLGPLGGEGTVRSSDGNSFSLPARNISTSHRKDFVIGNSFFKENWVATPSSVMTRQGLGPLFNATSCSSCHFKDGRGQPPESLNEPMVSILVRVGLKGERSRFGGPAPDPVYGEQIQNAANLGIKVEADPRVEFKEIQGQYPDGSRYTLLEPHIKFKELAYGPLSNKSALSLRVAPGMQGVGLLEALSESDILAHVDENDKDQDGISGRANWVWDFSQNKKRLGRFGWKSNQPSIFQQTAGAFLNDIGISSPLFHQQNCSEIQKDCLSAPQMKTTEISAKNLRHVVIYSQLLAVPAQRQQQPEILHAGRNQFHQIGCAKCHVENFTTSMSAEITELKGQKIHPYTDLLLHDMGEGLADGREDFLATGSEWRTAPLWGLGLVKTVNQHTRFLHDGRARNFEEAILWHGGEAASAQKNFKQLNKTQRKALVSFLESL